MNFSKGRCRRDVQQALPNSCEGNEGSLHVLPSSIGAKAACWSLIIQSSHFSHADSTGNRGDVRTVFVKIKYVHYR